MTADDVVFSINDLIYDLHRPAGKEIRWPSGMSDILTFDGKRLDVSAPDPYTVKIVCPVRFAILPDIMGQPFICSKK
jgi:ABC-type transport system substrate-binding protein